MDGPTPAKLLKDILALCGGEHDDHAAFCLAYALGLYLREAPEMFADTMLATITAMQDVGDDDVEMEAPSPTAN